MFRTKIIAIMAIVLLTLVAPTMAMHAEAASPVVGNVLIQTDQSQSDSAVINLSGVAPAPEGSDYQVTLKSNDGRQTLSLGAISVVADVVHGVIQSTGSGSLSFNSSSENYTGANLISTYSRVTITQGDEISFAGHVNSTAIVEIDAMLDDINSVSASLGTALTYAESAKAATDSSTINSNITSMVESLSSIGTDIAKIDAHATAASVAADDLGVTASSTAIIAVTANINNWVDSVTSNATDNVIAQSEVAISKIHVTKIAFDISAALNGWDSDNSGIITASATEGGSTQAYATGQSMATMYITSGEDAPELEISNHILNLGLPNVGDPMLSLLLQLGFVFSIVMIGFGGLVYIKNRN
jgi:hypothetical protein